MKRVVFYPDRSVDREGDIFFALLAELGIEEFEIDGDPAGADFVVYVGKERAREALGRAVKSGPQPEQLEGARVYVLPSTAAEQRGRFFEGAWRNFAAHLLGRDLAVRDEYKGLSPEEVKTALEPKRFDFSVLVANLVYDFNLGSIIRTANAFLAREVCIYGRKKADLRGAMGSYVYENVVHLPDRDALDRHAAEGGWSVVCFEETDRAEPLADFSWPERPLMVFGQEGPGIPAELLERADFTVVIPQFGSIRSLNAGVAAGIAMYDWHAKR